jgi:hypothetical protein
MTDEELCLAAVHHVVHDYANFVSSGEVIFNNPGPQPPLNTHVQHAFLMNCRKMAHFFQHGPNGKDIVSADFFPPRCKPRFRFPVWNKWAKPMDWQMLHLTYSRVLNPVPWDGYKENRLFLNEFQQAWKLFRAKLPEPYSSEYRRQIEERYNDDNDGVFKSLDLW